MWIYSLGITLHRTLPSSASNAGINGFSSIIPPITTFSEKRSRKVDGDGDCQNSIECNNKGKDGVQQNRFNNNYQLGVASASRAISLDQVIASMRATNIKQRASLMYLLNVSITILFYFYKVYPLTFIKSRDINSKTEQKFLLHVFISNFKCCTYCKTSFLLI